MTVTQLDLFNQDFVVDGCEIWKEVEGYEGLYEVSNFGRVRSLGNDKTRKTKILKAGERKDGYLQVGLCKNKKQKIFRVHRIVAQAFIPNPLNLPEVNHKDEDKTNNRVENLEWCSRKYNVNYGTCIKRQAEKKVNGKLSKPVISTDKNGNEEWFPSAREAERLYGFHQQHICACLKGRIKTHAKRKWRYADC